MADIMGTDSLAWYQWEKHGRCAGLDPAAYFAAACAAFDAVTKPQVSRLNAPVRLPARVVEEAFLEANPSLSPDAVTITCKAGRIQEARICLSRGDLSPRRCGPDAIRDCGMEAALLEPIE